VKAQLALPSCGIAACTKVSIAKKKEMEREANVGMENVATKSKKNNPLRFLRKNSNKFPFECSGGGQAARKRQLHLVQWTRFFRKRNKKSLISSLPFFLSKLHILYCCTLTSIY